MPWLKNRGPHPLPGGGVRVGIRWLFAAALVPGLLAGSVLFYDVYRGQRNQLEQAALQTARALSRALDRDLAGILGKLHILAASEALQRQDLAAFYRQAQDALVSEGLGEAIVLVDGAGQQRLNTVLPYGSALPRTGHPELSRRTFETGIPSVSDLHTGGATKRPFVVAEVPVFRDGKVLYALDMGISGDRLNRLLAEQGLPEGWFAVLLDSQGTRVARSRNAARAVGQKVSAPLLAQIGMHAEGTTEYVTSEGLAAFVAFSRADTSGWTLVVGMTHDVLYRQLYRPLALASLTFLAFLAGGAILARLFSRQVLSALHGLGAATEAATRGDLHALARVSGPSELSRLAEQFNTMQEARRSAETQLRLSASVFGAANEGILIADKNARIIDVNQAFTALTGYHRDEVVGENPRLLKSGKHSPVFYQAMWRALNDTGHWRGEMWNRRKDGSLVAVRATLSAVRSTGSAVSHYVALFSDITELQQQREEIERLAYHDPLTQLPNRRLLLDRMHQTLSLAGRHGTLAALCYLDLDGFKPINDLYGHEVGDRLLLQVARRLGDEVRPHDTLARLGGDEFVLLLGDLKAESEAEAILARVLDAIREPFLLSRGRRVRISASIGMALYPEDGADPDLLLRHADQAMYQAKRAGGDRVYRVRLKEHTAV